MSLILEALKKSEARRNLGEAPGIGTPFTIAPPRRSALPLLVVLIVVAGGLGWYFLRTPPAVTESRKADATGETITSSPASPPSLRPSPAARAANVANAANPVANAEPGRGPFAGQAAAPLRPLGAAARPDQAFPTNAPTSASTAPNAEPGRGPFGARQGGAAERALEAARAGRTGPGGEPAGLLPQRLMQAREARARMPGAAGPATPAETTANPAVPAAPPAAAAPAARAAAAPSAQTSPPVSAATAVPHGASPGASAVQVATATPVPAPGTPKAPGAATSSDLPMYYELPFNVRKDLPTLIISMHVFAAAPDQRFVMIDGERKAEGETFKDVTLREIRPDGIVLEFRGQRFFYPRSGH
jgi:general secretion pathway protein B